MISLKKNITAWLTWSTCSIALLPAVPNFINSICMMAWVGLLLLSLILSSGRKDHALTRNKWLFLLVGGNFLFLSVSLLYSTDLQTGLDFLVTEIPMLIFPLCIFLIGLPIENRTALLTKVFTAFWLSTVVMTLWVFYNFWRLHLLAEIGRASRFNTILRETAGEITDKHPDYLSIYLVFAIFIAAGRLINRKNLLARIMYGCSIPVFLFLLFVLAARSPIIALIIGSLVICFLQIKNLLTRWVTLFVMLGSFLLIIRYTPAIYSRVQEVMDTPLQAPVGVHFNSTNIRVGIYQCSWDLIRQHFIAGVGVGSEHSLLMACYTRFPTDAYQKTYYNTHNQYLNFWMVSGIFSLLLFLGSLAYLFSIGIRRKDYAMLFFLILVSIAFISENVLSSQAGIVFYYFFICLMVSQSMNSNSQRAKQASHREPGSFWMIRQ